MHYRITWLVYIILNSFTLENNCVNALNETFRSVKYPSVIFTYNVESKKYKDKKDIFKIGKYKSGRRFKPLIKINITGDKYHHVFANDIESREEANTDLHNRNMFKFIGKDGSCLTVGENGNFMYKPCESMNINAFGVENINESQKFIQFVGNEDISPRIKNFKRRYMT